MWMLGLETNSSTRTSDLNCWTVSPVLKTILEVTIASLPQKSTFQLNNNASNESIQQSLMFFLYVFLLKSLSHRTRQ